MNMKLFKDTFMRMYRHANYRIWLWILGFFTVLVTFVTYKSKKGRDAFSSVKAQVKKELEAKNLKEELLADAKAKGVKCYVGSAAPRLNIDFIWGEAELDSKLDGWVCGDDIVNFKPHPEVFLTCCERMGLKPEECVVFEDAISGIKAGVAAGCKVVGLDSTAPAEELMAGGIKHVVSNFEGMTIESLEKMFDNK